MANFKLPSLGLPSSWPWFKATGTGTDNDPYILEVDGGSSGGDASAANQTTLNTEVGIVTETAPATDTASSGLNGRLQRIAQRITSMIALLPASLGQKAKTGSFAVTLASDEDLLTYAGIVTETAPATDTASSGLNGRLQRIAQRLTSLIALVPASLGQKAKSASFAVTLASDEDLLTYAGGVTEAAPGTDTASSGLNGRLQRIAQRLTSLIALVPASLGQKAMTASLAVVIASDQASIPTAATLQAGTAAFGKLAANSGIDIGDVDVTSISAGENHLGEVGNAAAVVTPTITASTSPAYTAGDSIGGKITLTSALRVSGGISILNSLMLLDRANQKPTGTILIFNADPSAATLTDNAAFVFSTDDQKVVAAIPVASTDWTTINSKAVANLRSLAAEVKAASGTTLYAAFVVTSTPTFAATTDLQIMFEFIHVN